MADRRETFERELSPEPGRTGLVVVDMQRGFLDPGEAMEVPPARETVAAIQTLLQLFRARRMPVAFTEFVYSESAPLLVGPGASIPSTSRRSRVRRAASAFRPRRVSRVPPAPTPAPTCPPR